MSCQCAPTSIFLKNLSQKLTVSNNFSRPCHCTFLSFALMTRLISMFFGLYDGMDVSCLFTRLPLTSHVLMLHITSRILPVTSLLNPNLSEISFVINTLSLLTFVNHFDFADGLQETLPGCLYSTVLYPSFFVLFVIVVLAIHFMCCCIRKISTVYTYLYKQPKSSGHQQKIQMGR